MGPHSSELIVIKSKVILGMKLLLAGMNNQEVATEHLQVDFVLKFRVWLCQDKITFLMGPGCGRPWQQVKPDSEVT